MDAEISDEPRAVSIEKGELRPAQPLKSFAMIETDPASMGAPLQVR
jgi:hypothetical protein